MREIISSLDRLRKGLLSQEAWTAAVDLRIVSLVIVAVWIALMIAQSPMSFFPSDFSYHRLPRWAPFSLQVVDQYVEAQPEKGFVLLGDSAWHGDGPPANLAMGYRLSRDGGFINLTNPSLNYPDITLLLDHLAKTYSNKKFVVEVNTAYLRFAWRPEKFYRLESDIYYPKRSLLTYLRNPDTWKAIPIKVGRVLALEDLRMKIQWRWLNDRPSRILADFVLGQRPHPAFIPEEEGFQSSPIQHIPVRPPTEESWREIRSVAAAKPDEIFSQDGFVSFFEEIKKNRGRILVVVHKMNPGMIEQVDPASRKNYDDIVSVLVEKFQAAQIPVVVENLDASVYIDQVHVNEVGHQRLVQTVEDACRRYL